MNKNKKIIIALLLIIIALIIAIGAIVIQPEKTSLIITSNTTLEHNDTLSVQLIDKNNNPLVNKTVSIDFSNNEGNITSINLTTDDKGIVKFNVENMTPGAYSINCSFIGDLYHKKTFLEENITINEEVIESSSEYTVANDYSNDPGAIYDHTTGTGWHATGEVIYDPRSESYWEHQGYNDWKELK